MNFLDKWNKAKFNAYESEEKTVLKIINKISAFVGEMSKEIDQKTDLNGNHLGAWQGINKPTLSDEGMRGTVEKINDVDIPLINNEITSIKSTQDIQYNKLLLNNTGRLNIMDFEGNSKEEKFKNAIKYTQENVLNTKPTLFVPNGVYDFTGIITDTIVIDNLNHPITIIAESTEGTIFDYSTALNNKSFFKITNASGTLRENTIENITFIGNDTTTLVSFENTCGTKFVKCKIGKNKIGGAFNNSIENGFTEFVGFKDCQFTGECEVVAEYNKLSTDISFHGTGLEKCLINQSETSTKASIIINDGAFPYNAPMDFTIWTRGNRPIISNFSGSNSVNFYGHINVEPFNLGDVIIGDKLGWEVLYSGTLSSNNQKVKLGYFRLCDRVQVNSDLSVNTLKRPTTTQVKLSNKTELVGFATCETKIIDLQIRTANFEIQHTLLCSSHLGASTGNVTILARHREFNVASLEIPTYTFENGMLYVNGNYEGKEVNAYIVEQQIGQRTEFFMQ